MHIYLIKTSKNSHFALCVASARFLSATSQFSHATESIMCNKSAANILAEQSSKNTRLHYSLLPIQSGKSKKALRKKMKQSTVKFYTVNYLQI